MPYVHFVVWTARVCPLFTGPVITKGEVGAGDRSHRGQMLPLWKDSCGGGGTLLCVRRVPLGDSLLSRHFLQACTCNGRGLFSLHMETNGCSVLTWKRPVGP